MKIIDSHCDVLYKIQQLRKQKKQINFQSNSRLQVDFIKLQEGNIQIQFFAIFIDSAVPQERRWAAALEQIQIFRRDVLTVSPKIVHIRDWRQIDTLADDEIGAILAIEGMEAIGFDLEKLAVLYQYGVLSVGLTWNQANLCADGVAEPIKRGLTPLGKEVIRLNNEHLILTDLAHLSQQSFWEVLEVAKYPFVSHANAKAICLHPRNLTDKQIEALILKRGQIQLTFYPPFIQANKQVVEIVDLLKHLEHICSLGGANYVGFGSDFDGIDQSVWQLRHCEEYENLVNQLLKRYASTQVEKFLGGNFLRYLETVQEDIF